VVYRDLYPGIDLIIRGEGGTVKQEYRVKAGADIEKIRIRYEGIEGLGINRQKELVLKLRSGILRESIPLSYQISEGERVVIDSAYRIVGEDIIGFHVGAYDTNKELIIDPSLDYASYLGATKSDSCSSIEADKEGNVYVTGSTDSDDFPTFPGSFNIGYNGGLVDAFITKLNPSCSALVYSTYIGGNASDYGIDLVLDGNGNVFLTGYTASSNFPTTEGAYDSSYNGGDDVFIAKLNSTASALSFSTFVEGGSPDIAMAIAVDGSGDAYVTGHTWSTDYPVTPGCYCSTRSGRYDAFLTKIAASGSSLKISTYLGGTEDDMATGIDIDTQGNTYLSGWTLSTNFPTTPGALATSYCGGYCDAFAAKFNASGSALLYSTYIGGEDRDYGMGIVLDGSNSAYLTGYTKSLDFPATPGAISTVSSGEIEVWVAKLNSSGSGLSYCTYLGGESYDYGLAITLDECGDAYVCGETWSDSFPVSTGAFDETYNGSKDGLIAKIIFEQKDDFLGTWTGQGVYYRNSDCGAWVQLATPASQITCGDLDGDGTGDLVGIWAGQGGVWVKNSDTSTWQQLSSTADWISCGKMREDAESAAFAYLQPLASGFAEGPGHSSDYDDLSSEGPGGWNFVYQKEENLVPTETEFMGKNRIPGPGEPGFTCIEQKNLIPRRQKTKEDLKKKN
jgi:hypothetical protein